MDEKIDRTQKDSEELKKELSAFRSLEEIMVKRVYKKARKLLAMYLTIGGFLLLLSTVIGITSLAGYNLSLPPPVGNNLAQQKVETSHMVVAMDEKINQTHKDNEELRKELSAFKSLKEDMMARRVFEKARKLLTIYLTVGGVLLLLSSIIGIKSLVDYAKTQAKNKVESISKEQISAALREEGRRQIAAMVKERETEFIQIAQQQVTRIVVASRPIEMLSKESATTPSPAQLDYTSTLTPVRNQGREGGSVGFAVAAAIEYHVNKIEEPPTVLSPRYIYHYARKRGKFPVNQDSGAFIRDAVSVLRERGTVSEKDWPYIAGEYANEPPNTISNATHYKIEKAQTVAGVSQLKTALSSHGPVPGGITFFSSSFVGEVTKTGKVEMPGTSESPTGGHAICFVGYDDDLKLFKFKNSWGSNWGDNGYGYLPYEYVEKFLTDAWTFLGPPILLKPNNKTQPTQ